jgi:hypothetical protein
MPLRPIGDSGQSLRPGKSPLASEKRHFVGNRSGELSSRMLSGKQIRKTRENANDSSTPQAASQNRSVPRRPPNGELRSRKYLTKAEVEKLIKAARNGRYGHLHGLRAVEICDFGHKSSSADLPRFMSGGPRTASLLYTPCVATTYGHCASYAGNSRIAPSCFRPSVADPSPRTRLID